MKHCREITKRLKEEFPGLEITRLRQRTHVIFELNLQGRRRVLSVSTSPKNTDHAVDNAVKEARKLICHDNPNTAHSR